MLGERLAAEGWAVRGTSRREEGLAAIEAAGFESAAADPERPGTVLELVGDVAVVVFLLGSAVGDAEAVAAIHGPRLEGLLERLVDTPVRGIVYEAAGSVEADVLERGAELVRRAGGTWRIPVAVVASESDNWNSWVGAMASAVASLLTPAAQSDR
jgi:uncharacterized protein YbjT (DUF2867 family)